MQQQVSLSCETKVIEPVGNNEFPRGVNGARKICDVRAPENASWDVGDVEPAHNTIKILCPNLTVRLSISPACCNKGLNVCVEERCLFAESNRFAVCGLSD